LNRRNPFNLDQYLDTASAPAFNAALDKLLPPESADPPTDSTKAMRYSISPVAKRMPPRPDTGRVRSRWGRTVLYAMPLCLRGASASTLFAHPPTNLPVHGRRTISQGQPTNHKVFGEGVAVLAGDAPAHRKPLSWLQRQTTQTVIPANILVVTGRR